MTEINAHNFGRRIAEIEERVTTLAGVCAISQDRDALKAAAAEAGALVYEAASLARRFPFEVGSDGDMVITAARARIRKGVIYCRRRAA